MTPKQREAALRLGADQSSSNLEWSRQVVALLRELAAEPVQEPVAWMAESKSGTARFTNIGQSADELESLGWAIVPLYAAPQQPMRCPTDGGECGAGGYCRPEPQQRKPLSDEVVAKLINDEWATPDVPSAWKFARAIERAHGITGEPT